MNQNWPRSHPQRKISGSTVTSAKHQNIQKCSIKAPTPFNCWFALIEKYQIFSGRDHKPPINFVSDKCKSFPVSNQCPKCAQCRAAEFSWRRDQGHKIWPGFILLLWTGGHLGQVFQENIVITSQLFEKTSLVHCLTLCPLWLLSHHPGRSWDAELLEDDQDNHGVMEWFGLEGTIKPISFQTPVVGRFVRL